MKTAGVIFALFFSITGSAFTLYGPDLTTYITQKNAANKPIKMVLGALPSHDHFLDPDMIYVDFNLPEDKNFAYPVIEMDLNDKTQVQQLVDLMKGQLSLLFTDFLVVQHLHISPSFITN